MRSGNDMRHQRAILILLLIQFLLVPAGRADEKLTIVKAGPVGEVRSLAEANEIRIVFSEPMVALGKIPKVVAAPFFHITPAVIALRFNQPVDAVAVGPHLQLRTKEHPFQEPAVPLQPTEAFNTKVAAARTAASSDGVVISSIFPPDWDRKRFPASPDLVVV